jgi:hypothetical protein
MSTLTGLTMTLLLAAVQHPHTPGMSHDDALKQRGAAAMGFDQDAAAHHFRLAPDGGAIEVVANDAADARTIAAIRGHLQSIAREFAAGKFDKPLQTHGEMPPGVDGMKARRQAIAYRYEERPRGGVVHIATKDAAALDAVHAFLRYQIKEHGTAAPIDMTRAVAHSTNVMSWVRRLAAVAAMLTLGAGNLAMCAGWQPTPRARMACCKSAARGVTQAQADSCCASASDRQQSSITIPAISLGIAPPPTTAAGALVRVPAPARARAFDPLPVTPIPKHLLFSVLLI